MEEDEETVEMEEVEEMGEIALKEIGRAKVGGCEGEMEGDRDNMGVTMRRMTAEAGNDGHAERAGGGRGTHTADDEWIESRGVSREEAKSEEGGGSKPHGSSRVLTCPAPLAPRPFRSPRPSWPWWRPRRGS